MITNKSLLQLRFDDSCILGICEADQDGARESRENGKTVQVQRKHGGRL